MKWFSRRQTELHSDPEWLIKCILNWWLCSSVAFCAGQRSV